MNLFSLMRHTLGFLLAAPLSFFTGGATASFAVERTAPPDFVTVEGHVAHAVLEIRYASSRNFVGKPVRGYDEPVAIVTRRTADALAAAASDLRKKGYGIKFFDAYRPQRAVEHFTEWAKDLTDQATKSEYYPDEKKSSLIPKGYIAMRSGHSRGSTVDITLYDLATGKELDMGGTFDLFGKRSHVGFSGLTPAQKANREVLRSTMLRHGFRGLGNEWWHFTLKNEPYPSTYFDFPNSAGSLAAQ